MILLLRPIGCVVPPNWDPEMNADWGIVGAASQWTAVNEEVADGDVSYLRTHLLAGASYPANCRVSFSFPNHGTASGSITNVRLCIVSKDTTPSGDEAGGIYPVMNDDQRDGFMSGSEYAKQTFDYPTNPKTPAGWTWEDPPSSTPWTWEDIDTLTAGVLGSTLGWSDTYSIRITQLYLEITYSGVVPPAASGMFVAVAFGDNVAASSPDGITWTARTLSSSAGWMSVTYGNGLFVAVAQGGFVATSPDGITWTARTLPPDGDGLWFSVAYGNGMFVATAYGTVAASSPDGITWTARTLPESGDWFSVTYGGGMFVAVGDSENTASSPDGITWTARTLPAWGLWYSVIYGNGMFVAVDEYWNDIITSPDGITWTARTLPSTDGWISVAYGNGLFVIVACGSNAVITSPDGITWTARTLPSITDWRSVTYGNGMFVVVVQNSNVAASSPDGITWTARTLSSSDEWASVTYGGTSIPPVPVIHFFNAIWFAEG